MTKYKLRKQNRSGTYPCEICKQIVPLVEHHINGRDIPNWNKPWNIVWICPNCHDKIHMTPPKIIIQGWYMTTTGRVLIFN